MMPMKLMTAFQIQETKESHLATEQKPFITKLVGGRYGRTACGIFNWGLQNLLDFYMKVDLVEGNFNIL